MTVHNQEPPQCSSHLPSLCFFLMTPRPPSSTLTDTLFPYTTLSPSFQILDYRSLVPSAFYRPMPSIRHQALPLHAYAPSNRHYPCPGQLRPDDSLARV